MITDEERDEYSVQALTRQAERHIAEWDDTQKKIAEALSFEHSESRFESSHLMDDIITNAARCSIARETLAILNSFTYTTDKERLQALRERAQGGGTLTFIPKSTSNTHTEIQLSRIESWGRVFSDIEQHRR